MINLEDMQVYLTVVDNSSFSGAGRKLRMSVSLVSSRIGRLEKELGTRLLNRTTRSVEVTPTGQSFYEECQFILGAVQDATARVTQHTEIPRGSLKVSVPVALGQRLIVPNIGSFLTTYPEIDLQLELTDRYADILNDRIDIAVRIGEMEDSNFKARILSPVTARFVGSPQYFKKRGIPQKPSDLNKHNCLLLRFPGSRQFKWRFQKSSKLVSHNVNGKVDANNTDALRQMAINHLGLSMQYEWDVSGLVQSGELISVLESFAPNDATLHAIYPYENFVPARLRVFLDFLQELVRNDPRFQTNTL